MKHRKWLFGLIILLIFSLSALTVQAQDDAPPLDDDFINALVIMAVNHDMMAGQNEIQNLRALKDYVDQYYEDRLAVVSDSASISHLLNQQIELTMIISQKIVKINEQNDAMIDFFIDLFTTADDDTGASALPTTAQRWQTISGSDDPPTEYMEVSSAASEVNLQSQVTVSLDTEIISTYPSLEPAIAEISGWSYNASAIVDLASAASGGDGESFVGDDWIMYKPLRFINNGFEPVTVVVETYDPPPGYEGIPTPTASTVVFQENNPSAMLSLPLGTYTFCYYWQLDEDFNDDNVFDYHHRTTAKFSLNENSSDNTEAAFAVILSPDSVVSNPNGRCGEFQPQNQGGNLPAATATPAQLIPTIAPTQAIVPTLTAAVPDESGLTAQEEANKGTHMYLVVCHGSEIVCATRPTMQLEMSVVFVEGGVKINSIFRNKVGLNQYAYQDYLLTFTMDGMTNVFPDGSSDVYTRQD